MRAIGIET